MPELAIIDEDTFAQAQERLSKNKHEANRNRKREYLFVGHMRCTCGRAMIGKNKKEGYRYYMCAGRSLARHLRNCDERFVNCKPIDEQAWHWLADLLTNETRLTAALDLMAERKATQAKPLRDDLVRTDAEIERLQRSIRVWVGEYADASGDEELAALKASVKEATARLEAKRKDRARIAQEVEQGTISPERRDTLLQAVARYQARIKSADYETKRCTPRPL